MHIQIQFNQIPLHEREPVIRVKPSRVRDQSIQRVVGKDTISNPVNKQRSYTKSKSTKGKANIQKHKRGKGR